MLSLWMVCTTGKEASEPSRDRTTITASSHTKGTHLRGRAGSRGAGGAQERVHPAAAGWGGNELRAGPPPASLLARCKGGEAGSRGRRSPSRQQARCTRQSKGVSTWQAAQTAQPNHTSAVRSLLGVQPLFVATQRLHRRRDVGLRAHHSVAAPVVRQPAGAGGGGRGRSWWAAAGLGCARRRGQWPGRQQAGGALCRALLA